MNLKKAGPQGSKIGYVRVLSRVAAVRIAVLLGIPLVMYALWSPGVEMSRGRFDQSRNALWMAHGWLSGPDWFVLNDRSREPYEGDWAMERLRRTCQTNGIAYVFPHLCPTDSTGALPQYDPAKVSALATALPGVKIVPWVGGVLQQDCVIHSPTWRATFVGQCADLLSRHPELDGIHRVPTYEDTGVGYHHPRVESLSNALAGVNAGLEQLGDARGGFAGIAVYADWTTTEDEWRQFRRRFRDR